MCRLVEALEDYEGGDPDAYSDVSAENSLLSGGHKRRVSIVFSIAAHSRIAVILLCRLHIACAYVELAGCCL